MNSSNFKSVTDCVILAGGKGSRMGIPKALLEINRVPLIQKQFELLSPLFKHTYVALKDSTLLDATPTLPWTGILSDPPESRCLLDVIGNAIREIGRPIFVAAVDIPLMNPTIINEICSRHKKGVSVIPVDKKRPQPLAAVWDPAALSSIAPDDGDLALLAWVRRAETTLLDWPTDFPQSIHAENQPEHPFQNLNTPEDLQGLETAD
ncbi:MAG: molybdenum cofactor guanylyltransferase [Planctomycetota bacterium]